MGMESVYKLSVILNLVDNLSSQMNGVQSSVSGSVSKLNSAFGTMQKAGAAMAGIGGTITGLAMKTVTATFDTQNALGELSSLGVKDLKAVEDAAKSFSDTWAGTSKADFITASYDIKSGIASLTDEGVAQFTQLAALTGKATKSTTEEMGSLFATGYGIYKGFYDDMSDLEFGEMFSAGIATAVKNYKTSGSEMASAISALGATATNANVPLEEQLAIMGQLQTTMSGSEAATKYKSFLNQASSAGEKLGNGFPEISLLLPLCNELDLSVNELLTGERISETEYREKAEENMVNLVKEAQESKKKIILSGMVSALVIIAATPMFVVAGAFPMEDWMRIALIAVGIVVIVIGIAIACILDRDAGAYECPECKTRFVPEMGAYVMGPHTLTRRKLVCPHCGAHRYCKKVLTR